MIDKIKQWSGVVALVAIVLVSFWGGKTQSFGNVVDTSYFDIFDATTAFKLAGTTFLSATSFSLPSGVTAETVNGITTTFSRNSALTAATTTPCAILAPAATTTLRSFVFNVTTGTSTAGTLAIGTSTTAYATSTSLQSNTIGSSGVGSVTVSPTSNLNLIAPSSYVTVGVSGVPYGFTYGGSCTAVFQSVS